MNPQTIAIVIIVAALVYLFVLKPKAKAKKISERTAHHKRRGPLHGGIHPPAAAFPNS